VEYTWQKRRKQAGQLREFRGMMKRIPALTLVVLSLTWSITSQAQIYRGPNSAQQAQKAARKDQRRAAKRQRKASKKLLKAQRKAAKRTKHRA
jgi:hypothetical protein